jgi:hypothetical protein
MAMSVGVFSDLGVAEASGAAVGVGGGATSVVGGLEVGETDSVGLVGVATPQAARVAAPATPKAAFPASLKKSLRDNNLPVCSPDIVISFPLLAHIILSSYSNQQLPDGYNPRCIDYFNFTIFEL